MYTLRTIFQTEIERNNYLGNNYEIIKKENTQEFEHHFYDLFKGQHELNDKENVYAFIITPKIAIPLYETSMYYIVNQNGKTYQKI
jgi:succinate dehydrogenase/fumarate reductase flavoprotein subunit